MLCSLAVIALGVFPSLRELGGHCFQGPLYDALLCFFFHHRHSNPFCFQRCTLKAFPFFSPRHHRGNKHVTYEVIIKSGRKFLVPLLPPGSWNARRANIRFPLDPSSAHVRIWLLLLLHFLCSSKVCWQKRAIVLSFVVVKPTCSYRRP